MSNIFSETTREEKQLRDQLNAVNADILQTEQNMRAIVAKATMNGVESVRRLMTWFTDNNADGRHDDVVNGYHGLYQTFTFTVSIVYWKKRIKLANLVIYQFCSCVFISGP